MNTERDKFLTEAMGECWHIREGVEYYTDSGTPYHVCRCGKKLVFHEISTFYNPNFSTWEGFGKLLEWTKEQYWFPMFITVNKFDNGYLGWVEPDNFANAVYKYLITKAIGEIK